MSIFRELWQTCPLKRGMIRDFIMAEKKIQVTDVVIDGLSKEGSGTGESFFPNKIGIVEVPFTMPGDTVSVELGTRKRGKLQSRLLTILNPSEMRDIPRCIHFGSCGGCRWQHIPYSLQLQEKEKKIRALFSPFLKEPLKLKPMIPAPSIWHYRNKMEFTFSSDRAGNRYLGLIMLGSNGKVFNLEVCHLVNDWFAKGVGVIFEWWKESGLEAYHPGKNSGSLRTLTMREAQKTGDRLIMLTVSGNADYALTKPQMQSFVQVIRNALLPNHPDATLSIFIRIQQISKGHPTNFYELLLSGPDHMREILEVPLKDGSSRSLKVQISPTAFFQPNTYQAEQIYSQALSLADIGSTDRVYDLYCGTGILGLCASVLAKEVVGIEICPESVLDGKENLKLNQIENMTFEQGDVRAILQKLASKEAPLPDVVLVDPPRAGLEPKAIETIIQLKAARLVYISCNPSTQAENIAQLLESGYEIQAIQPIDQFPHTVHLENIILLTRT